MPAANALQPSAVGAGSSKSTTSRKSSRGSWMRMPAPSPLLFGARGAAVLEVFQGDQAIGDDGMRAPASDVDDHGDTTGVGLALRVVQTLGIAATPRTALR